jgi:sugar lactone lactonase YvrE
MSNFTISFSVLLTGLALPVFAQQSVSHELFKSSVLTPVNSSTNGIEGPAVDKEGTLYWVNYSHQGTIGQLSSKGEASVFIELPEGSIGNGIRFDSKGNMMIADYTNHNILMVDMTNQKISVFAHESRMSQPNDIAIDSKDRLYASDPDWKSGTGRIWLIDAEGKVTLLDSLGIVNGIDLNPGEKTLYVNSSRKIFAYDISPDGTITNKRLLIEFPDFGMDGMRCDIDGNLYIARFGKGVVAKVSPEGKLIREINLAGKRPTNVAFGGVDGRTVYVTLQDMGNLESFRADLPGREWQMQRNIKIK